MKKNIFFLVVIIIIAFAGAWYIDTHQEPPVSIKLAEVTTTDNSPLINALSLNINAQTDFSETSVETGNTALFIIFRNQVGNQIFVSFIRSPKDLYTLDIDKNRMINASDRSFGELALLTLQGAKRITPLTQSGILSIQFNPSAYAKVVAGQPLMQDELIAQALMSNGKVYPVKFVTINKTRINSLLNP